MSTLVLLLRGVNVAGKKLAMADLRALLGGLGLADVRTYVQSGNAVFEAVGSAPDELESRIEKSLEAAHELRVAALVRTAAEMAAVAAADPFDGADVAHRYVTFLKTEVQADGVAAFLRDVVAPDRVAVIGREAHLLLPGGYGRTKLSNELIERRLGTRATTRNWRSVTALVELAATGSRA